MSLPTNNAFAVTLGQKPEADSYPVVIASDQSPIPVTPGTIPAGATAVKKYYTHAGAVTDGIVWSPASATRWHVGTLFIGVSAACTVTLEDDLSGGDDPVFKMEFAANSGVALPFSPFLTSGEDAADLMITTTTGNVYVTITGYEG